MAKETESIVKVDGIILYSDGGCSPNPGQGGWGFHGFAYSNDEPKKGSGNPDNYVTNEGYVIKSMYDAAKAGKDPYENLDIENMKEGTLGILDAHMRATEVTPLYYLDHFGPSPLDHRELSTNNISEIHAFTKALEYCIEEDIRTISIFTDSSYTLDGWNKALSVWARNGWRRRDGMTIQNVGMWKHLWELKALVKDFTIRASWIPGHSIFLGNQLADTLASLGKNMTNAGIREPIETKEVAQGYWKASEVDKHPLISHQKLFFNSDSALHEPGIYYMGSVDNDLGLMGKRLSDSTYSVLRLKEPVASLESLMTHHSDLSGNQDEIAVGHLANFFKPSLYKQFTEYGKFAFYQPNSYNNDLMSVDKQMIVEVVNPPKKSLDAVLAMNNIGAWLDEWLEAPDGSSRFTVTDLTPHLYETTVVQKKKLDTTVTKLKASIAPGMAAITIDVNYRDSSGSELVLPTTLTFGIDIANRNGLKRVEESSPQVTLLSWEETPGVFRYFSVIQVDGDVGAYCGYYSNMRLNKAMKKKSSKKD